MKNTQIRSSYTELVTRFEILEISEYVYALGGQLNTYVRLDFMELTACEYCIVGTVLISQAAVNNVVSMLKEVHDAYLNSENKTLFYFEKSKLNREKNLFIEAYPRSAGNCLIPHVMIDYSDHADFPRISDRRGPVLLQVKHIPDFINGVSKSLSQRVDNE